MQLQDTVKNNYTLHTSIVLIFLRISYAQQLSALVFLYIF